MNRYVLRPASTWWRPLLGMPGILAIVSTLAAVPRPALAQPDDYPSRPVRIVVPFAAGGVADALPRLVGQKLSEQWGKPVVVDNKPGAAG